MKRLDEIVKLYLNMETNYALMITGDWGIGKTFYYNNVLEKVVSDTPTLQDAERKYKPIRISLFGLKSISDIQNEIFLSFYSLTKKRSVRITHKLFNAVTKSILQRVGLSDLGKVLENEMDSKTQVDLVGVENLVLCFDDLERISEALNIEELIGYINSLVENDNIKIIIIANEDKIKRDRYSELKEKVVGNTIEFNQDFGQVFDDLIMSKFSSFQNYQSFLRENRNIIISVFTAKSNNLRILNFTLSHFHHVFSEIEKNTSNEPQLTKNKKYVLSVLLKFTIAVSIEYKMHKITYNNRNGLDEITHFWGLQIALDNKSEIEGKSENYKRDFIAMFYRDDVYYYFQSVYDFITGGNTFNFVDVCAELKKHQIIEDKELLPQYVVLKSLYFGDNLIPTNTEYKKLVYDLLNYTDEGKYKLHEYGTVFYLATMFDNPLRFKIDKLEQRIVRGMRLGKKTCQYTESLDFHMHIPNDSKYPEVLARIKKVAFDINTEIGRNVDYLRFTELENLLYDNFDEFKNQVFDEKTGVVDKPFLGKFNTQRFYSHFLNEENDGRRKLSLFFKRRYKNISNELIPEIDFLEKLSIKIKKKIDKIKHAEQPSKFIFEEFYNYIFQRLQDLTALAESESSLAHRLP